MIWTVIEEQLFDKDAKKHAGGKAREDINSILGKYGVSELKIVCPQEEREEASKIEKLKFHHIIEKEWEKVIEPINSNDTLILQFPVLNHTLLFNKVIKLLKRKHVKIVAIIHDLEMLRMSNDDTFNYAWKWRMKKEEIDELALFEKIIVHNYRMKEYITKTFSIPAEKIIVLGIFDYLIDESFKPIEIKEYRSCIIAGNLNRNKSSYVYDLPQKPDFELYGVNYEEKHQENIHYHGSFLADELPYHLKGGFGLVWDGDSSETCIGAWGKYLRYNNPHKTSLYLACGIPVVIWEEAALADYIKSKDVGLTVESLYDLDEKISKITNERYQEMKNNAMRLSDELRNGWNTYKALKECGVLKE